VKTAGRFRFQKVVRPARSFLAGASNNARATSLWRPTITTPSPGLNPEGAFRIVDMAAILAFNLEDEELSLPHGFDLGDAMAGDGALFGNGEYFHVQAAIAQSAFQLGHLGGIAQKPRCFRKQDQFGDALGPDMGGHHHPVGAKPGAACPRSRAVRRGR